MGPRSLLAACNYDLVALFSRLKVRFKYGEQFIFEKRPTGQQARKKWIAPICHQSGLLESGDKTAGTFYQGDARGNVPLIFRSQCECDISAAGGHKRQFVGDGAHGLNAVVSALKLFPLASLHLAAAGQN